MNISGTPQTPHIDFDLDLPTVSNEAEQMVRTVINSEEEMNQQVVYLLSIGRFYMQDNNNSSNQENQQNQTSLAMQSLLSGTISQQINSLLGNLVKTTIGHLEPTLAPVMKVSTMQNMKAYYPEDY